MRAAKRDDMAEQAHDEASKAHASHGPHGGDHGGGGHEEHEGAPEWLISFADNVTLMMGFFVILLAMNLGPKGGSAGKQEPGPEGETNEPPLTFLDAAISIRQAFNNPVSLNSVDPNEKPLVQRIMERQGKAQIESDGPKGDDHDVQSIRPSKYFSICGVVPFETGNADLTPSAAESLEDIAKHIRGLRLFVDVRGNVSAAESYGDAEAGMRLSFARAMVVAQGLVARGVEWKQIRLVACADNDRKQPVVYEKSGHRTNERVDIVVSDQVMLELTPPAGESTEPPYPR